MGAVFARPGRVASRRPERPDGSYVVAANVCAPDPSLRFGVRVVVVQASGDARQLEVRGLSRQGRGVTKWIHIGALGRFRVAFDRSVDDLPPHARRFEDRAGAQAFLEVIGSAPMPTERRR